MMLGKKLAGLWLLIVLPCVVQAQEAYDDLVNRYSQASIYSEAFGIPGGETSILLISFRIPNSRLVFFGNRYETPGNLFVAEVELLAEVYRDGKKVGEEVWRKNQYAKSFSDTQSKEVDLEGIVHFYLTPGTYGYRLLLKDTNTGDYIGQSWLNYVVIPDYSHPNTGKAIVAGSFNEESGSVAIDLINLGGDVPYGGACMLVIPIGISNSAEVENPKITYTLYRRDVDEVRRLDRSRATLHQRMMRLSKDEDGVPPVLVKDDIQIDTSDIVFSAEVDTFPLIPISSSGFVYHDDGRMLWSHQVTTDGYLLPIDLSTERLANGAYLLEVSITTDLSIITQQTLFRTHWRNMPLSLHDVTVAIRNLRFMIGSKEIREMLRGRRTDREEALLMFWRERDPTPETEYNELMAEYYSRIDHAALAFRTGKSTFFDGLKTDQSHVYVVHGPADIIERSVPPGGGVREVWQYLDGRQFIFWSPSSTEALVLQRNGVR